MDRVPGAFTNAIFYVSCPSVPGTRTVLLRVYGPSSGSLVSRPRELRLLHILSSQYHIGPRIYVTFVNGRLEEYYDGKSMSAEDMRDPKVSRWIAARMEEIHKVDVEKVSPEPRREGEEWDIGVHVNVKAWLPLAHEVLALPGVSEDACSEFNLPELEKEWDVYLQWLSDIEDLESGSKRVFAHSDFQCGNLLLLRHLAENLEAHRRVNLTFILQ